MANNYFGERIRVLRKNNNLSMQELANKLGVTKGAVNMWENRGIVPRDDILLKVSQLFNVSIDSLLGNQEREGMTCGNEKLEYIQRGLEKMDNKQLTTAENMLKAVFEDIFNDDEGDDSDDL